MPANLVELELDFPADATTPESVPLLLALFLFLLRAPQFLFLLGGFPPLPPDFPPGAGDDNAAAGPDPLLGLVSCEGDIFDCLYYNVVTTNELVQKPTILRYCICSCLLKLFLLFTHAYYLRYI